MRPGDLIILPTQPPHVASIIDNTKAMCEDGDIRSYTAGSAVLACSALEMVVELEKAVLNHDSG